MTKVSLLAACLMPLALAGCGAEGEQATRETTKAVAPTELTDRVIDAANILPDLIEADMTRNLAALEEDTLAQVIVVTVPSLNGYEISDYTRKLGNGWGVGDKDRDDGVILLIAPNDRKMRIAVGLGLEDELPDLLCAEFISKMLVHFRNNDMVAGALLGVDLIDNELRSKLEKQS